jgi:hypothetical protein
MRHQRRVAAVLSTLMSLTFVARVGTAQTGTSGLAGVVRDDSGAVLPGVTVEASSPALIERVRTVVTDGEGQYKIVSLPPGTYAVTFTLPSFATVKRDGIELTANFTGTVNADMKVGAVAETITVSGQSPIVDVQNTATQNLISSDKFDAVPTAKTLAAFAALTPGLTAGATAMDVGGSQGEQSVSLVIHGGHGPEQRVYLNGMNVSANGRMWGFMPDPMSTREVSLGLGGGTAEYDLGGAAINHVSKDGGNIFAGSFFATYAGGGMQGDNLSAAIQARGLTAVNKVKYTYDIDGGFGGPILKDRLWFFTAHRRWASAKTVAGEFGNSTPQSYLYTKDSTDPAVADLQQRSNNLSLTWQVTPRNKIRLSYDYQNHCDCHRGIAPGGGNPSALVSPEASWLRKYLPNNVPTAAWTFVATNKLLFEAGVSARIFNYQNTPQPDIPGLTSATIPVVEQSIGLNYRAAPNYGPNVMTGTDQRFAVSYVTGSHAFKVGVLDHEAWQYAQNDPGSGLSYTFNSANLASPTPVSLTEYATPAISRSKVAADLGIYLQDQWTIRHLTLNLGVRYQYLQTYIPAQQEASGPFVPARSYAGVPCVPCWNDLSPRLSAAYDLFGNGKTALKGSFGRYEGSTSIELATPVNPPSQPAQFSATRSWTDSNHNFVPDCDLTNPDANGECGPNPNPSFGTPIITTHYASDVNTGWGHRPFNWQTSVGIQHEVRPGLGVTLQYYRTVWKNLTVTDNLARTASSFDSYCITAPLDSRLPNGGGYQACGLYDLKTTVPFSVTPNNLVAQASTYGTQTETYNGFDLTGNARLPHGAFIQGGLSVGMTATNNCYANSSPDLTPLNYVANTPRTDPYCNVNPPFWQSTQIKFAGSFPLPWDTQLSGVWQTYPGIPIAASYVATTLEVQNDVGGLGRPLVGGAKTVTIANIIPPFTMFEGRIYQLDLRLTKIVRVGRTRIQGNIDLYNVLNANPILAENTRYGSAWLTPIQILDARLLKVGGQVSF